MFLVKDSRRHTVAERRQNRQGYRHKYLSAAYMGYLKRILNFSPLAKLQSIKSTAFIL